MVTDIFTHEELNRPETFGPKSANPDVGTNASKEVYLFLAILFSE